MIRITQKAKETKRNPSVRGEQVEGGEGGTDFDSCQRQEVWGMCGKV